MKTTLALLLAVLIAVAQDPPRPPATPALEAGVTTQRSALAAPAAGRSVLVEVEFDRKSGDTNDLGCIVFWGSERSGYTNFIDAIMPETSVPPVAQIATARINNLGPGELFFAAQMTYGTNHSDFYPTNGLRWPTLYSDDVNVEVSNDALATWQSLGSVAAGRTNSAAFYRVRAVRTEVP